MRKIGLHIRLTQTLDDVARRALSLQIPIFQCFFIQQETNQFLSLTQEQIQTFLREYRTHFENLYVHGSYWINLASVASHNKIITREVELAKKLEFTHMVVHPGSTKKARNKREGITTIAKNLNKLLKTENEIRIILENTAHAGLSVGGDLQDFLLLRERLDYPEKISFCIDTAHAFAYGYDITTEKGQLDFITTLDSTIGLSNIALIHLNDTAQLCGSRIDKHEKLETGLLAGSLQKFINHEALKDVSIIMELPVITEEEENKILQKVRNWNKE